MGADGCTLQFYGFLSLACQVRDIQTTEDFVVGKLREDLGMPFLIRRGCTIEFDLCPFM